MGATRKDIFLDSITLQGMTLIEWVYKHGVPVIKTKESRFYETNVERHINNTIAKEKWND